MAPDPSIRPAVSSGVPALAEVGAEVRVKPRLRGVFHQYAFFVSLGSGSLLVLLAPTTRATVAVAVYAVSVAVVAMPQLVATSAWWAGC